MNPDHYYSLHQALRDADGRPDVASAYALLRNAVAGVVAALPVRVETTKES